MEKRCLGCMEMKQNSPVCEHCGFDERMKSEQDRLPIGTILRGRYLIGKTLGQGGFGITYIGLDRLLDIPVAIKEFFPRGVVMRDTTFNTKVHCYTNVREEFDKSKARFLREAKTLAKFMHIPEIVQVRDFFEDNDTAYIVMEYVKGMNLHQYMKMHGGKLSVQKTLELLKPVMEALIQVHDAHLVHRDISPDNIMLLEGGKTKLLDFGAVREIENPDAEKLLTRSTQTILKRGFAPVEQYRSRGNLGPWTDVYGLCATIYCCLTGQIPPESQELLMEEEHIPWEKVYGLNSQQIAALRHGTELLPSKRLASVRELFDALYAPKRTKPVYTAPLGDDYFKTAPLAEMSDAGKKVSGKQELKEKKTVTKTPLKSETGPTAKASADTVSSGRRKKMGILAAAAALVVLLAVFGSGKKDVQEESDIPVLQDPASGMVTIPVETQPTEPMENLAELNMLMAVVEEDEDELYDISENEEKVKEEFIFNTKARRREIKTITFLDDTSTAPADAVDASYLQNGRVKAWVVENGELYDLYIAADGGVYAPKRSDNLFECLTNTEVIHFNGVFHTETATDLLGMFISCRSLVELNLNDWDVSNVTNMDSLFAQCDKLTTLKIDQWDTSSATNIRSLVGNCPSLRELDISGWNISNVTNMEGMFVQCHSLEELGLRDLDTANVTNMAGMFMECYALTELDLSGWDVSCVTTMQSMFADCSALTELNVSGWDVSSAEDISTMFYGCKKLKRLDLTKWNTSNVSVMMGLFAYCNALTDVDISGFDISKVSDMRFMFTGCPAPKPSWYSGLRTVEIVPVA